MSYILCMALAFGQCDCGPSCACSQYGPCFCVRADADAPPPLPSIDRGVAIADELRRPVVVWVGQRDVDAEAALPEAIHCYAAGITAKSGPGVAYAAWSAEGGRSWLWRSGTSVSIAALAECCGSRCSQCVSGGCAAYCGGGYGILSISNCAGGQCGIGQCGIGQCAGCQCAIGQCAGGQCAGGRGGRRR